MLLDLAPVVLDATDGRAAQRLPRLRRGPRAAPRDQPRHRRAADADRGAGASWPRRRASSAFVVDATAVHDRGASDVQELRALDAVGAAYLRTLTEAGVDLDDAAGLVEFRYAATDEQFPTIAKLRAARRLWARVLELSGGRAPTSSASTRSPAGR